MRALAFAFAALAAAIVHAQNAPSALDRAYEEARAAYLALQEAEARRDAARARVAGDTDSAAAGGTQAASDYRGREYLLEHEVEMARRRYEAAVRRWNELK